MLETEFTTPTGRARVVDFMPPPTDHLCRHLVRIVECIEGHVEFHVGDSKRELTAGKFLYLTGGDSHSLLAKTDSIVLVTILLAPKSSTAK